MDTTGTAASLGLTVTRRDLGAVRQAQASGQRTEIRTESVKKADTIVGTWHACGRPASPACATCTCSVRLAEEQPWGLHTLGGATYESRTAAGAPAPGTLGHSTAWLRRQPPPPAPRSPQRPVRPAAAAAAASAWPIQKLTGRGSVYLDATVQLLELALSVGHRSSGRPQYHHHSHGNGSCFQGCSLYRPQHTMRMRGSTHLQIVGLPRPPGWGKTAKLRAV
jgi:hypothetical protein